MTEKIFEEMFDDTSLDKVEGNTMKSLSTVVKDLDQLTQEINQKEEDKNTDEWNNFSWDI